MPTITPFLWFDTQAQEAMAFYTSIFKDSKVIASNPMTCLLYTSDAADE